MLIGVNEVPVVDTTQEVTAQAVAARIMETAPLIMYFIRRNARKNKNSEASIARVRVLAFLQNCPDSSLTRLSESLGVTNATASTLVESLVQAGLVARKDDPAERRRILLRLTKTGQQQLETSRRLRVEEIVEVISNLSPSKLKQVEESLTLLKDSFNQSNSQYSSWSV